MRIRLSQTCGNVISSVWRISSGYSDFIVSEDGPVILETNTIPGMTDTSLYPDEIRHTDDMTFPQVCDSLIRMGLRRAGVAC